METLPQMMMNLTPAEVVKSEYGANPETGLLASTKQHSLSSSCQTQDAVMAESTEGAGTTVSAGQPPEMEALTPGITEKESSSQIPSSDNGEAKVVSSKGMLHEFCSINKWKAPEYELCLEQCPALRPMFVCKVIVEIPAEEAASTTFLECFSNPMPKKKAAMEHAASGAIWYLKQLGFLSPEGKSKSKRRKNNHKKLKTEGEYSSTSQ